MLSNQNTPQLRCGRQKYCYYKVASQFITHQPFYSVNITCKHSHALRRIEKELQALNTPGFWDRWVKRPVLMQHLWYQKRRCSCVVWLCIFECVRLRKWLWLYQLNYWWGTPQFWERTFDQNNRAKSCWWQGHKSLGCCVLMVVTAN